jgi:hypothetical protein
VILNVDDVLDERMHKKERPLYSRESNVRHFGFVWPVGDGSLGF